MTPFTDRNMWYGRYVKKSSPVVSAVLVRQFERDHYDQTADGRIARGEIGRAHSMLDDLNVPRLQPNGLSLSLEGRLRHLLKRGGKP